MKSQTTVRGENIYHIYNQGLIIRIHKEFLQISKTDNPEEKQARDRSVYLGIFLCFSKKVADVSTIPPKYFSIY